MQRITLQRGQLIFGRPPLFPLGSACRGRITGETDLEVFKGQQEACTIRGGAHQVWDAEHTPGDALQRGSAPGRQQGIADLHDRGLPRKAGTGLLKACVGLQALQWQAACCLPGEWGDIWSSCCLLGLS